MSNLLLTDTTAQALLELTGIQGRDTTSGVVIETATDEQISALLTAWIDGMLPGEVRNWLS